MHTRVFFFFVHFGTFGKFLGCKFNGWFFEKIYKKKSKKISQDAKFLHMVQR
jgi:hypothetical protein